MNINKELLKVEIEMYAGMVRQYASMPDELIMENDELFFEVSAICRILRIMAIFFGEPMGAPGENGRYTIITFNDEYLDFLNKVSPDELKDIVEDADRVIYYRDIVVIERHWE